MENWIFFQVWCFSSYKNRFLGWKITGAPQVGKDRTSVTEVGQGSSDLKCALVTLTLFLTICVFLWDWLNWNLLINYKHSSSSPGIFTKWITLIIFLTINKFSNYSFCKFSNNASSHLVKHCFFFIEHMSKSEFRVINSFYRRLIFQNMTLEYEFGAWTSDI